MRRTGASGELLRKHFRPLETPRLSAVGQADSARPIETFALLLATRAHPHRYAEVKISRGSLVQLLVGERFILQADAKCGLTPNKITEIF
jgi:hypothetical protein